MRKRGAIQHRDRARQLVDFRNLHFGTITPTDLDGLIEYKNACYLMIELKHISAPQIPVGQRIALERLCDDLSKPALLLHALHSVPVQHDIDAASAIVERFYWQGCWRDLDEVVTVYQAACGFFENYGNRNVAAR